MSKMSKMSKRIRVASIIMAAIHRGAGRRDATTATYRLRASRYRRSARGRARSCAKHGLPASRDHGAARKELDRRRSCRLLALAQQPLSEQPLERLVALSQ